MKIPGRCYCGHPEGSLGCHLYHLQPENRPISLIGRDESDPTGNDGIDARRTRPLRPVANADSTQHTKEQ